MFHVLVSPLVLLIKAAEGKNEARIFPENPEGVQDSYSLQAFFSKLDGKNLSMIQLMELDACTHCGMCTSRCSVVSLLKGFQISYSPFEKLASI